MSTEEKLIERIKIVPADFSYDEAKTLAKKFNYEESKKGKTSGSRVMFFRKKDGKKIMLHKPHPGKIMKKYAVIDLLNHFKENGDIT